MKEHEQFTSLNAPAAAQLAFGMLGALQTKAAGHQLAAIAMLFALACKRMKANPADVLAATDRRITDALSIGRGEHIRAIQNYLKEET